MYAEPLCADTIRAQFSPAIACLPLTFDTVASTPSTNTYVAQRIKTGTSAAYVCAAEQQTAGRGRHGRRWVSPPRANLYFSLGWAWPAGPRHLAGLSLAVGVALVESLQTLGISGVGLKWPNDLLYQQKKLGGILLELAHDSAGCCYVIVGVGVNIALSAVGDDMIDQPWTSLQQISTLTIARNVLLGELLDRLIAVLQHFECNGFAPYQPRWQQLDVYSGQKITVRDGEHLVVGYHRGVDSRGALRLATAEGERCVFSGDVALTP